MGFVETIQLHPKPTAALRKKRDREQSVQDKLKNMSWIKYLGTLLLRALVLVMFNQCLKEMKDEMGKEKEGRV